MAVEKTRVKMLLSIAGHGNPFEGTDDGDGFGFRPQEEVEIESSLAEKWIAAGHCELVEDTPKSKKK